MKLLIGLLFSTLVFATEIRVYDTLNDSYIEYSEFISRIPDRGFVVLGEYHNDQAIQNAQAKVIEDKGKIEGNFKIMWEFLNFTEQEKINGEFTNLLADNISPSEFVERTAGKQNLSYTPIFEVAKKYWAKVVGLNLPRPIKQKIIKEGIDSVDPNLIPYSHELGGENYYARFKEAMGGHAPSDVLEKYFLVQSLTDSVMGYHAHKNHLDLSFIIAGSFHTDFFDGLNPHLKKLSPAQTTLLKFVNGSKTEQQVLDHYLKGDEKYGEFAQFILIVK